MRNILYNISNNVCYINSLFIVKYGENYFNNFICYSGIAYLAMPERKVLFRLFRLEFLL